MSGRLQCTVIKPVCIADKSDDAPNLLQCPRPLGIGGCLSLQASGHTFLACRAARQARDLAQQKTAVERMLEREVRSTRGLLGFAGSLRPWKPSVGWFGQCRCSQASDNGTEQAAEGDVVHTKPCSRVAGALKLGLVEGRGSACAGKLLCVTCVS